MISYELARQLKEAHFPDPNHVFFGKNNSFLFGVPEMDIELVLRGKSPMTKKTNPNEVFVFIVYLEELIEACGDELASLHNGRDYWSACSRWKYNIKERIIGEGNTPEEAVANLYLAIHKKNII